jgi:succinate dehydrogenase flavin-adding protein (antitoxin of CptAB toxin-antitoxin module)
MSETLDAQRKRLIHRSRYTGMKETDILLGSFAVRYVPGFTPAELDAYERLLTAQDPDIFDWATGRSAAPQEHNTPILKLLMNHRVA